MIPRPFSLFALGLLLTGACSSEPSAAEPGDELGASDEEVNEVVPGPMAKATDAEVWSVTNQWTDKDTPEARKAGVAWSEASGLTWQEKYAKWVASFERIDGRNGFSKTIRITTPQGRKLDGPVLECADVATWLRMTFASFYHLPFYMTGHRNGQPVYFGHFGVVDKNGNPVAGFPRYKRDVRDFEASWRPGQPWPSDARLRGMHVGSDDGAKGVAVEGVALPEGAGAGAYFDELFLNKRAGYLMVQLDVNFGSANLADGANMFHVTPEAIAPGDALLERWQKVGIGHTLPVITVDKPQADRYEVTTASGSMPRRQPDWQSASQSSFMFSLDATGGEGNAFDGNPYAKLGGGIRRWRTPVIANGRWNNIVPVVDRPAYIADGELARIAARPARFKELLREASPEQMRDGALAVIQTARRNLQDRPASCSSRTTREEGFAKLYEVMERHFGKTRAEVDAEHRVLEDYVFAELEYNQSKTCCWNTTTPQMREIIVDFAQKERQKNDTDGVCREVTVFKASGGGKYDTWAAHAAALGRAADWRAWSEDEPCPQRGVADDAMGAHGGNKICPAN